MNALLDFKKIERISSALGDPYRLKIIEAVRKESGWLPCGTLTNMLNISQSTVSHHLKQLVDAELLLVEKEGRKTRYTINKEVFAAFSDYLKAFS